MSGAYERRIQCVCQERKIINLQQKKRQAAEELFKFTGSETKQSNTFQIQEVLAQDFRQAANTQ